MNALQPWHLIILVLVVLLLFGAKKLPDAARSVGKSMKIFRAETKDMRESGDESASSEDAEPKQLSSSEDKPHTNDDQVASLQRQLDELKQQQSADPANKNSS